MTTILYKITTVLFAAELLLLLFYYHYATLKVYNLKEEKTYEYIGYVWLRKRGKDYYLILPERIMESSYTTQYRIVPGVLLTGLRSGRRIRICFGEAYEVCTEISETIHVKNHIATSYKA